MVLKVVEHALPWVHDEPENSELVANLVWALDFAPGRDPVFAERARVLRDRVLEPLRALRPPPAIRPDDPDWIEIPAGTFLMGSPEGEGYDDEHPRHEVAVSAFRILRHEVTNAEYRLLAPAHLQDGTREDAATWYITWHQAYTYAAWLGGRLPTEAEWEYAARAGCPYAYCDREGRETTVFDVAWTSENRVQTMDALILPAPVMGREPNPWGLYDMLGNTYEWTACWWSAGYPSDVPRALRDPWGPTVSSSGRVFRGGGLTDPSENSRVAFRGRFPPNYWRYQKQGFRVVLPVVPEP